MPRKDYFTNHSARKYNMKWELWQYIQEDQVKNKDQTKDGHKKLNCNFQRLEYFSSVPICKSIQICFSYNQVTEVTRWRKIKRFIMFRSWASIKCSPHCRTTICTLLTCTSNFGKFASYHTKLFLKCSYYPLAQNYQHMILQKVIVPRTQNYLLLWRHCILLLKGPTLFKH